MAELFIELFSEEIPANLQVDARKKIKQMLEEKLKKKEINFKSSQSFSTPKRLVFFINGLPEKIEEKGKIIKGPKIGTPEVALEGFIKSNNLSKSDVYKDKIEKGEFYFAKTKSKTIDILKELQSIIPEILKTYSWKKSMKWSNYDLNWARPLKSIISLFNKKIINFDFFHLKSGDLTSVDGVNDDDFVLDIFQTGSGTSTNMNANEVIAALASQESNKEIHPKDNRLVVFQDESCDYSFLTRSTVKTNDTIKWEDGNEYPLYKLEISDKSHHYLTGKQNLIDSAGRIEKFNKKYKISEKENNN